MQGPGRGKVFISYSHADQLWLRRFQVHLKSLSQGHAVLLWDDTRIKPGQDWTREIQDALGAAIAAVLLISADFLGSHFIRSSELPSLLDAAQKDGITILPVILKPCRFRQTPYLGKLQAVNDPDIPMVMLTEGAQEQVWVRTVDWIEAAIAKSSPEARREIELASIRSDLRAYLAGGIECVELRQRFDSFLKNSPNLTSQDRRAMAEDLNIMYADLIIIYLGQQIADCYGAMSREPASLRLSIRSNALSDELDRWMGLRESRQLNRTEFLERISRPGISPSADLLHPQGLAQALAELLP